MEADINGNTQSPEADSARSLKPRLAQIDDSGIGSPVGGAAIGVLDTSTGMFKYKLVGVEYFQDGYKNEYQDRTTEIVRELFEEMGITNDVYRVEICSGHIFDHVRPWFDKAGFEWKSVKIIDPLQSLIENAFSDFLISLGVPERIRTVEVGRDQFMYLFNWVKQDPEHRVKHCKTNGTKWKTKWSHKLYEKQARLH